MHATAHTPDVFGLGLKVAEHGAIGDEHGPRVSRSHGIRRRRPIDCRPDIQERMTRRQGGARNIHGGIDQTGQLGDGWQPPAFPPPI
jgi:hypothetical protein